MHQPYPLTERFQAAFAFAHARHSARAHFRKETKIPYVAHLMSVSAIVLEHDGDETEAIAALLHDIVEDTATTLAEVAELFGGEVEAIVRVCTDSEEEDAKPPWRPRKEAYVAGVRRAPLAARRVIAADKLHNARAIVQDHDAVGDAIWLRFSASPAEVAWYYEAVRDALTAHGDLPETLTRLLSREVEALAVRARRAAGGG